MEIYPDASNGVHRLSMITTKRVFGTDGIRGIANTEFLTPEFLLKLGKIIGLFLKKKPHTFTTRSSSPILKQYYPPVRKRSIKPGIILGRDPRISGYMIENALVSGILASGINVTNVGIISTPGLAYLTRSGGYMLGIMISASHNPTGHNGVKLFSPEGLKIPDKMEMSIEKYLANNYPARTDGIGCLINGKEKVETYISEVIKRTSILPTCLPRRQAGRKYDLSRLKIALDCANGSVAFIAPRLFSRLGAKVILLNNQPDGKNINCRCGSLYPEILKRAVRKHRAHIGFSFDGDGDRVILADEKGIIRDGDYILAIMAHYLVKHNQLPHRTVVATVMSNAGLEISLREAGIKLVRTQVGDRYVLKEMLRKGYILGGEQCGHIINMKRTTTGDGIITALEILKIMVRMGKSLVHLAGCMKKYPQVLVNLRVKAKPPLERIKGWRAQINSTQDYLGSNARLLIRYSGTEPVLRIMIEGENKARISAVANDLARFLRKTLT